ncbi:UDP-N-acetylmuramoyl-tripeptide--D-alanyl-D-alanine ligase [Flocculibacter collagenilyticus]|uniref:UDP-N-acetylmuramoyl-tripeptide--D-alanyl-D- alanine ligase n=1 Tax=Flocculibacter collagenilyticus TaxID=2744479 RepID=UPI0018F494F2|nr:UDP-N-acetylmuramoyl-tripeptide--D-alanyl-D-alanine ligase [Flocculibacter collagenilyticus]
MIKVTLAWLAKKLDAKLVGKNRDIEHVNTDTRTLQQDELFIALRGPNFDGHNFADLAVEKKAAAIVVDHQLDIDIPQLVVADTKLALGHIGKAIRDEVNPKVIAITGSAGKTTIKEMTTAIMSRRGNVLSTKGNFNNEIGVPLTLLRLQPEHDIAVVELGANHLGEIAYTTSLASPDYALISNVAEAHLEGFGDIHGVARAKGEIFTGLPEGGIAIYNADSEFADYWQRRLSDKKVRTYAISAELQADFYASDINVDKKGCASFTLNTPVGTTELHLTIPGNHNVANAVAAASLSISAGASLEDVKLGLAAMQSITGRVNLIEVNEQLTVIDDTYNANVESVKAAIELLSSYKSYQIFVLGDMAELGHDARMYHEQVGEYAKEKSIDNLFTLGVLSQSASEVFNGDGKHFSSRQTLLEHLHQLINAQSQPVTVVVKGSRSSRMELVVNGLMDVNKDTDQENTSC